MPGNVVAVLIDGTAVPQDNFQVTQPPQPPGQPWQIGVLLPRQYTSGNHTVQVNTQFNSQDMFSNNDVPLIIP
jgi:archaellum component FlaG (FlaF/FlaG flagellin family)